ncbi:IucA/IucC family protein [Kribbella sp. NPDC056861]|uniref:IucA/IucC family protein n=1 Tax=Kribbella sp. NPDC056861 TaxID=3154857 RepID=UPI00341ADA4F
MPASAQSITSTGTKLPSADHVVAHTLLNCVLREVSSPEHQGTVIDGHLLIRLPRCGALLRVALRRTSLIGAHRFTGPVATEGPLGWTELSWQQLAEYVGQELALRSGFGNEEFLEQVALSHEGVTNALESRGEAGPDRYLESEQALVFGHRFHPAPKSRSEGADSWTNYAPEARASFPLRYLAVREELLAEESLTDQATALLDNLYDVPAGYRVLPAHPWQYELLQDNQALRGALARGDVLDLGTGGGHFTPTASVRTLHGAEAFLKFSLNVRITNCLRKNAAYELTGAVAITRLLAPALDDLAARFPDAAMLREPAFRTLGLPGPDGTPDVSLFEGFGLIVRDSLDSVVRPGLTPLLAAAVADEYPTSSAQISRLLDGAGPEEALTWWTTYLRLLLPPVLAAYFDHGVVLEPHLQNVMVCVDDSNHPAQILFRDMEGTKLVPDQNAALLAQLPLDVAQPMTYDAQRGWDRVVYCLLVNNVSEVLAAIADQYPELEGELWETVRATLQSYADEHGSRPRLSALLAGVPLPAKANMLIRWARKADREAEYVLLPSPIAESVLAAAARPAAWNRR